MEFLCRHGTPAGEIVEGVYSADDEAQLRRRLEEQGNHVLALRPRGLLARPAWAWPRRRRVAAREFMVFNQELAALLKAGLPVVQSLDILRQRADNAVLRTVLDDIYDRVRAGATLSAAFEAHGSLCPGVYTAALLAGEQSGDLEAALRRYAAYARVISGVRRRTISALIYPAILLALSLVVVAIIVLRVTPEFAAFYGGLDAELPVVTQVILAISATVGRYAPVMLLVLAAAGVMGWLWFAQPERSPAVDRWLLRFPGVGRILGQFATSQVTRTLALLLRGGVPLVTALDVAARAVGNRSYREALALTANDVREGRPLAASMASRGLFAPVTVKMVEVGESTGALQEMLENAADFVDEELETVLGRLMTLVEPALLVIMGLIIAALLVALYMPLLQLGTILS